MTTQVNNETTGSEDFNNGSEEGDMTDKTNDNGNGNGKTNGNVNGGAGVKTREVIETGLSGGEISSVSGQVRGCRDAKIKDYEGYKLVTLLSVVDGESVYTEIYTRGENLPEDMPTAYSLNNDGDENTDESQAPVGIFSGVQVKGVTRNGREKTYLVCKDAPSLFSHDDPNSPEPWALDKADAVDIAAPAAPVAPAAPAAAAAPVAPADDAVSSEFSAENPGGRYVLTGAVWVRKDGDALSGTLSVNGHKIALSAPNGSMRGYVHPGFKAVVEVESSAQDESKADVERFVSVVAHSVTLVVSDKLSETPDGLSWSGYAPAVQDGVYYDDVAYVKCAVGELNLHIKSAERDGGIYRRYVAATKAGDVIRVDSANVQLNGKGALLTSVKGANVTQRNARLAAAA